MAAEARAQQSQEVCERPGGSPGVSVRVKERAGMPPRRARSSARRCAREPCQSTTGREIDKGKFINPRVEPHMT